LEIDQVSLPALFRSSFSRPMNPNFERHLFRSLWTVNFPLQFGPHHVVAIRSSWSDSNWISVPSRT
jgi:hypothetical protein